MKIVRIKPSSRLVTLFTVPFLVSLAWAFANYFLDIPSRFDLWVNNAFYFVAALIFLVLGFDYWRARRMQGISCERLCKSTISVNRWQTIALRIHHQLSYAVNVEVRENFAWQVNTNPQQIFTRLQPEQFTELEYQLLVDQRGELVIAGADLCLSSEFGLWKIVVKTADETRIKVYPDFGAITGYILLATDNHVSQLGIKLTPRRGEGLEFHQLREYRDGDSLRQIDWKASVNKQKLISKEYQDERDQQIVIMMDSGRRMRAQGEGLGQFDQSINAAVLLSYLALRQGDAVGVMSFGGSQRWLPSKKGSGNINAILNHVYDLQPTLNASDYSGAAKLLIQKQRKRSLVILITNTRDEDVDDLLPAIQLLRRHHLVMLANIREPSVEAALEQPIATADDGYRYVGTVDYLERRRKNQALLQQQGVVVIDALPDQLPIQVINAYYSIKRAGYL